MAQKHLRKVKKAAEEVWRARRALDLAIIEAYESGETLRDIGDWAGVGHQRIHQIIKDSRAAGSG